MEEVREMIRKKRESEDTFDISDYEIDRFIKDPFSLSYEKKWF
ncbi:hypothetical protein Clocl_1994 [Acetivibrio clariflavus DSM 19732]|uniref:Uncharacterized protein n=1 Tax=Acetivibrio clariflavus (strain DSM 19732 / NBRC 101661 / EBR45) TaxID=720554 RepID=G8LVY9_ACECE|nr:hypothetical protein Clocl_1994 [Acetivibrio clariflavus DSM 19732]